MFGIPGEFTELRCATCGLVRLNPVPKNLKRFYPSQSYYSYVKKGKTDFFGTLRVLLIRASYKTDFFSHLLLKIIHVPAMPKPVAGTILDIGCGIGETLTILESIGWVGYGLDIDAEAIRVAKKRGLRHVSIGTADDIQKYPDNFFDAVRLYHVIEHLEDPIHVLRLIQRKLKPGGELIIGTPNMNSAIAKIAGTYWYNLDAPRHLYLFNPDNLVKLVKKNRFRNISVQYSSAGGWVGSLQYVFHTNLINRQWLVFMFNPFERLLDMVRLGDIFVLTATK